MVKIRYLCSLWWQVGLNLLLCITPLTLSGQRYISGCITNAENNEPVFNATVYIDNTTIGTTTDLDGNYQLKISPFLSKSLLGLNMLLPMDYSPEVYPEVMTYIEDEETEKTEDDDLVEDILSNRFDEQINLFPQEKIYLHTDKPYYLSGERIWFRAHIVDAATHFPVSYSRYIYVELINPLDSIVSRVKIREEEGAYHGDLLIPGDVPEGDYTLRAYTTFMRSLDEHYLFTKTIQISDPQTRAMHTETWFDFEQGRRERIMATFRFLHVDTDELLFPKSIKVSVNGGKMMNIDVDANGTASFTFEAPSGSPKGRGFILLEVVTFNYPYRRFIRIPAPDDDFDVSFYPEGGSLLQGTSCMVGFKAMQSNGQAINISGEIYDNTGAEKLIIKSEHLGMGRFLFNAEKGKTYYAVCQNDKGQSKRFELPASVDRGYALTVNPTGNNIYVSVLKPTDEIQNEDLYLLAHSRGIVQFAGLLEPDNPQFIIPKDILPSGVLHFILFDGGLNPVSERLCFINNRDQAQVTYRPDRENFARRSLVKNRVLLTDSDGDPLTGNFSVAVTSDSEVMPDSTANILTQLLLTSDLRGNIENPAYYFQNARTSAYMLDLLMLTQGWRRYDIAKLAQGRYAEPAMPVEIGPEISGTVKNVDFGRPVENAEVTAVSITEGFFHSAQTDKQGHFDLPVNEFPDGTLLVVSAENKGLLRLELSLNKETFPERTLPSVLTSGIDHRVMTKYIDKAELKFVAENGERVYDLPEVSVTARRISPSRSPFYSQGTMGTTLTEEELEKHNAGDVYDVLKRIPSLQLISNFPPVPKYIIIFRRNLSIFLTEDLLPPEPLILINDTPVEKTALDVLNISEIEQIDVIQSTPMYGNMGFGGVIAIYTKSGFNKRAVVPQEHIKYVSPLGYQQPVEFYVPKYDTPDLRNSQTPDLRTTIHWQPVVQTDETGEASFEFYTADEQTSYTIVIEGLSDDGKIIRKEGKLLVNN